MPTRLLAAVILLSAMTAVAQSQPQEGSNPTAPQAITADKPEADQFRIRPYPQAAFSLRNNSENNPTVLVHIDPHVYWGGKKRSDSDVLRFPTGLESPADAICYAIRSYLVVRDSPDSDSTHRDGSTTCVPAARFRVHTAVDHER